MKIFPYLELLFRLSLPLPPRPQPHTTDPPYAHITMAPPLDPPDRVPTPPLPRTTIYRSVYPTIKEKLMAKGYPELKIHRTFTRPDGYMYKEASYWKDFGLDCHVWAAEFSMWERYCK